MELITNVGVHHYIILSSIIFSISICGLIFNRRNILMILICIELMLLSANINFIAFSAHSGNINGQIFTFIVLTVAAAEAAIGLAILTTYYRNNNTIDIEDASRMRG